jgi:hypothetical protein
MSAVSLMILHGWFDITRLERFVIVHMNAVIENRGQYPTEHMDNSL